MTFGLAFLAAIGSGLMAGLFFIFSVTIMSALGKLPVPAGIAAMQSINTTILNPLFLAAFMGTALVCVIIAVIAMLDWAGPASGWLVTGALLYVAGTFLVTIIFNVPMNDALAAATPDSSEAASLWTRYLAVWTGWNHVRTVTSTAALGSFIMALRHL
ncbi:anthrone oxygenase family protein [Tardiphaga alba]